MRYQKTSGLKRAEPQIKTRGGASQVEEEIHRMEASHCVKEIMHRERVSQP